MKRHLLIGPLPPEYGGTTVLFSKLCGMEKNNKPLVVNTNFKKGAPFVRLLIILYRIMLSLPKINSMSLHVSTPSLFYLFPPVFLISFAFRKKLTVRKFGGDFINIIGSKRLKHRFLIYLLSKVHACFFETKREINRLQELGLSNVYWYPNPREKTNLKVKFNINDIGESLNIVFVGRVSEDKGALNLVRAVEELKNVSVSFIGPLIDDDIHKQIKASRNCNYLGVIDPTLITQKLTEYDLLCLPTYYAGEGYPGVIIEAFSIGLPIITTRWSAIPEIVSNGEQGLLCEPNNIYSLTSAIKNINDDKSCLQTYSENSYNSFFKFDALNLYSKFKKVAF